MFFFLVHLVMRRLLRELVGSWAVAALEVENAVLRHQLGLGRPLSEKSLGPAGSWPELAQASGRLPEQPDNPLTA